MDFYKRKQKARHMIRSMYEKGASFEQIVEAVEMATSMTATTVKKELAKLEAREVAEHAA